MVFSAFNLYTTYSNTRKTIDLTIGYQAISNTNHALEFLDKSIFEDLYKNPNGHNKELKAQLNEMKRYLGAENVYIVQPDRNKELIVRAHSTRKGDRKATVACCELSQEFINQFTKNKSFFMKIREGSNQHSIMSAVPIINSDGVHKGFLVVESNHGTVEKLTKEVMQKSFPSFIMSGVLVLFSFSVFIAFQIWYRRKVNSQVGDAEETYQVEFQSMLHTMRSIRHDFLNHIQVIQGLMKIGREDRAYEYVNSLTTEVETMELPVVIKNPALFILLQSKWARAQNEKVDMHLHIDDHLFKHIHTIDLIKIFSNLIDNAFDATLLGAESERFINVEARVIQNKYLFKVENIGPTITKDNLDKIFQAGFSTKAEKRGVPRGDGLNIVKQVVHKYGGSINVESNKNSTMFEVNIPFKP
ncbi:MAG TPA: ATP-binding protein [Metabacillus sp.]|nr:ATP-binding protein [Metabacillus sp.]